MMTKSQDSAEDEARKADEIERSIKTTWMERSGAANTSEEKTAAENEWTDAKKRIEACVRKKCGDMGSGARDDIAANALRKWENGTAAPEKHAKWAIGDATRKGSDGTRKHRRTVPMAIGDATRKGSDGTRKHRHTVPTAKPEDIAARHDDPEEARAATRAACARLFGRLMVKASGLSLIAGDEQAQTALQALRWDALPAWVTDMLKDRVGAGKEESAAEKARCEALSALRDAIRAIRALPTGDSFRAGIVRRLRDEVLIGEKVEALLEADFADPAVDSDVYGLALSTARARFAIVWGMLRPHALGRPRSTSREQAAERELEFARAGVLPGVRELAIVAILAGDWPSMDLSKFQEGVTPDDVIKSLSASFAGESGAIAKAKSAMTGLDDLRTAVESCRAFLIPPPK